jgi:uncharacterized glyoxalase superfamily metalloenzyme YdcJ
MILKDIDVHFKDDVDSKPNNQHTSVLNKVREVFPDHTIEFKWDKIGTIPRVQLMIDGNILKIDKDRDNAAVIKIDGRNTEDIIFDAMVDVVEGHLKSIK